MMGVSAERSSKADYLAFAGHAKVNGPAGVTHGTRSAVVLGKVTDAAGTTKCKFKASLVGLIESLSMPIHRRYY
jgi:hypothetical protein